MCEPCSCSFAGASNLAELNRVLNSTVMVRRLKSEVLDQLPPKRRQHVRWPTHVCSSCLMTQEEEEEEEFESNGCSSNMTNGSQGSS